jgi:hypothetical protein
LCGVRLINETIEEPKEEPIIWGGFTRPDGRDWLDVAH